MRAAALAAVVLLVALAGVGWRAASLPGDRVVLPCEAAVIVVDAAGERLACPDDPALAACPDVRVGERYRGCEALGPMPGALLLMRGQPIDVNRAGALDLQALSGIGPGLAGRLLEAREDGPFCSVRDLERVRGIGRRRAEALAPHVAFYAPGCRSP